MSALVAVLLVCAVLVGTPLPATDRLAAVPGEGGPGLTRLRWSRRRRRASGPELALTVAEAVAPALEAGLSPAAALVHAVEDLVAGDVRSGGTAPARDLSRWAMEVRAAVTTGESCASLLSRGASALDSPELALLARAWALTEETGGPLADAARTTAGLIRSTRSQRLRLTAAVAGARSTMNLLTVLPLGGPLLALSLGVDPASVYLGSPLCLVCPVAGILLALVGRAWVRRLVAGAVAGPVVA